jgi:hypothetical protein
MVAFWCWLKRRNGKVGTFNELTKTIYTAIINSALQFESSFSSEASLYTRVAQTMCTSICGFPDMTSAARSFRYALGLGRNEKFAASSMGTHQSTDTYIHISYVYTSSSQS